MNQGVRPTVRGILMAAGLLAMMLTASIASAAHLAGSIDCTSSNLSDLNAAIQSNFHTNFLGGFRQDSVFSDTPGSLADFCSRMQTRSNRIGNPGDPDFCYYPNAYDMVHAYLLYDPYDDAGNSVYSGHTNLYAGWDVTAFIGDVDADGNPNASTLQRCGTNLLDDPGIGPPDDYFIDFFNCTRTARIFSIHITNNHAEIRNATNAVVSPAGVTVTYSLPADGSGNIASSNTMKLCVTNLEAILAAVGAGTDINGLIAVMHAGDNADVVGEDFSCDMQLQLQPHIHVTKTAGDKVCPGGDVDYTIVISNPGAITLNHVTAQDVLGSGLTYASETNPAGFPSSTGDNTTRSWDASSANLAPGGSLTIHLHATASNTCAGSYLNTIDVTGNNTCNLLAPPATDEATFTVKCVQPQLTCHDGSIVVTCDQNQTTATTSVDVLNPGDAAPGSITYSWSGAGLVSGGDQATATWNQGGTKTVTVTFTDPGCSNSCSANVSVTSNIVTPSCDITATPGLVIPAGGTTQLCAPTGDNYTYLWVASQGGSIPAGTETGRCVTVGAGHYCVTVTIGQSTNPSCSKTCCVDVTEQSGKCWLTGGGQSYDNAGHLHSYGGVINPGCSATAAGGGNWNDLDHTNSYHFKGQTIQVVQCGNVPGIPAGSSSPKTDFNYILFKGQGTMFPPGSNKGTAVNFFGFYEDRHEPASAGQPDLNLHDRYFLQVNDAKTGALVEIIDKNNTPFTNAQVLDPSGISVTDLDADAVPITHGNLQLHQSGCDKKGGAPVFGPALGADAPQFETDLSMPTELSFGIPRPNPTGTEMAIRYGLPKDAQVDAKVYDVAGRMVANLGSGPMAAGWHVITWDLRGESGSRVGPGLYFVRLSIDGQVQTRNVTVLN